MNGEHMDTPEEPQRISLGDRTIEVYEDRTVIINDATGTVESEWENNPTPEPAPAHTPEQQDDSAEIAAAIVASHTDAVRNPQAAEPDPLIKTHTLGNVHIAVYRSGTVVRRTGRPHSMLASWSHEDPMLPYGAHVDTVGLIVPPDTTDEQAHDMARAAAEYLPEPQVLTTAGREPVLDPTDSRTAQLAANAITSAKIAAAAVTASKIADASMRVDVIEQVASAIATGQQILTPTDPPVSIGKFENIPRGNYVLILDDPTEYIGPFTPESLRAWINRHNVTEYTVRMLRSPE